MSDEREQSIDLEMRLHKAVDRQMDHIVQVAVKLVKLLKGSAIRNNQLRNLLDTALNTDSLELVANFIRYQIGRSNKDKEWQYENFGEKLIAVLGRGGSVDQAAKTVAEEVLKSKDIQTTLENVQSRARVMIARRFLGELYRAFLYADRTGNWKNLEPILETSAAPAIITTQEG